MDELNVLIKGPQRVLCPSAIQGHSEKTAVCNWLHSCWHTNVLSPASRTMRNKYLLYKTLENPFDCSEIKPINPKGDQP